MYRFVDVFYYFFTLILKTRVKSSGFKSELNVSLKSYPLPSSKSLDNNCIPSPPHGRKSISHSAAVFYLVTERNNSPPETCYFLLYYLGGIFVPLLLPLCKNEIIQNAVKTATKPILNSVQSHLCIQIFRPQMTQECKRLYKNISFFSF